MTLDFSSDYNKISSNIYVYSYVIYKPELRIICVTWTERLMKNYRGHRSRMLCKIQISLTDGRRSRGLLDQLDWLSDWVDFICRLGALSTTPISDDGGVAPLACDRIQNVRLWISNWIFY